MDTTLTQLGLSESLQAFVAAQVAERGFRDAGDYLRKLVEDDCERQADGAHRLEELRKEIAVGIEQGDRGKYEVYGEHNLPELIDEIQSEGRNQLLRNLESLRKDVALGLEQIERGECRVYNEHTLNDLLRNIERRGRERLANRMKLGSP